MSRWLKSVNNLLENLDGTVENVAEDGREQVGAFLQESGVNGVGVSAFLESGKKAILNQQQGLASSDDDDDSSYYEEEVATTDDDDDDLEFDEDDDGQYTTEEADTIDDDVVYEEYEEELEDDDEEVVGESSHDDGGGVTLSSDDGIDNRSDNGTIDEDEAVSIQIPRNQVTSDTISEMSGTEIGLLDVEEDDDDPIAMQQQLRQHSPIDHNLLDVMPKTPTRIESGKLKDLIASEESNDANAVAASIPEESTNTSNSASKDNSKKIFDQSPTIPRRSLDLSSHNKNQKIEAPANFLDVDNGDDLDDDFDNESGHDNRSKRSVDSFGNMQNDSAPPRPERKESLQKKENNGQQEEEIVTTSTKKASPPPPPPPPPKKETALHPPPKTAPPRSAGGLKPKETKEYQKLLAKVQSLQTQLKKTSSELKSSQMEQRKLDKQVKTLMTQLETANSEVHAQNEELRRAGERMEKDRKRADEEREELFDEHEEEVEQMKESHEKEINEMRGQYESQIAQLQKTLEVEESKRLQEGGDWTKELEDSVQRERDAIVKVNELETERNQLNSEISKLQTSEKSLQTKLESALQANKAARQREREAEDKLDTALSQHSRQISQRQAREAELEKSLFDLGAALTASQQKQAIQQRNHNVSASSTNNGGDIGKYKELYENAIDEVETLRGQLDVETQRREALQEELSEISKERTEEASSTQARQREHDRKVSELVANIAGLQKRLKEQKGGDLTTDENNNASGSSLSVPLLKQQLEDSKTEISRLSDSLMRHHGQIEASKAEIMTLRGRLQMATKRADDAEKLLNATQAGGGGRRGVGGGGYDLEAANVGIPSVRRRKGGRGRGGRFSASQSIRSALSLGPATAGGIGRTTADQIFQTIDAVDVWMIETGSFMRHEPLARIGFMFYLMTLHLWTFALVAFHTTEAMHGDFGGSLNEHNPQSWERHN